MHDLYFMCLISINRWPTPSIVWQHLPFASLLSTESRKLILLRGSVYMIYLNATFKTYAFYKVGHNKFMKKGKMCNG
jgi:hypothetical protein